MLDASITGIPMPSQTTLDILARTDVHPMSKVIIYRKYNGVEYGTEVRNVLGYEISEERQFGAASLSLSATNENGLYSYSNTLSEKNRLFTNTPVDVPLNLSGGTRTNISDGNDGIVLTNPAEIGEWVSDVVAGSTHFYSWVGISWDIDPGQYVRGATYHGSVDVLIRSGNTLNPDDGTWTPWYKVTTVTENGSAVLNQDVLSITDRCIQVKLILYAAYSSTSPTVKSISLKRLDDSGQYIFSPLYYYGNRIEVYEAVTTQDGSYLEWNKVFNGFIDTVTPSQQETEMDLRVEALDFMRILLNDYIEKPDPNVEGDTLFESAKVDGRMVEVQLEVVRPPGHDDNGDGVYEVPVVAPDETNSVFRVPIMFRYNGPIRGYETLDPEKNPKASTKGDYMYQPWVRRPQPVIYVDGKAVNEGYDIDYERGVVYFSEKKEKNGQPLPVKARFYWYDLTTNLFEDVVGEIIATAIERFGLEKPKRVTRTDDYDIWEAKSHSIKIILERSKPRTTIPPTGFNIADKKTFFDALSEIMKHVTPDYILRATPNGTFVGEYLPQKAQADYTLHLVSEMTAPISDEEVYTRCVARGMEPSVANMAMRKKSVKFLVNPAYTNGGQEWWRVNGKVDWLIDGNPNNTVGWKWVNNPPSLPCPVVEFEFHHPFTLGAVNICIGQGQGPPKGNNAYGVVNVSGIGCQVEVSQNHTDWLAIASKDFIGSTGEWIRIDGNDFMDDIKAIKIKWLRLVATRVPFWEWGAHGIDVLWGAWTWGDVGHQTHYYFPITEIQVFANEEIRYEVNIHTLVEEEIKLIPNDDPYREERIRQLRALEADLSSRLGTKTIVLPVDPALRTQEMVRARALDYLYETVRNLYTSEAEVIYAPHMRVGHTVAVYNPNLIGEDSRLYYVDGIRRSMDGNIPSVNVSLVSWV